MKLEMQTEKNTQEKKNLYVYRVTKDWKIIIAPKNTLIMFVQSLEKLSLNSQESPSKYKRILLLFYYASKISTIKNKSQPKQRGQGGKWEATL